MPTLAIVEGVRLVLYPRDHEPPHVHAFFGEHEVVIDINSGVVLQGILPKPKLRAITDWLAANRGRVSYMWKQTRAGPFGGAESS